jgi:hypothetical protein
MSGCNERELFKDIGSFPSYRFFDRTVEIIALLMNSKPDGFQGLRLVGWIEKVGPPSAVYLLKCVK